MRIVHYWNTRKTEPVAARIAAWLSPFWRGGSRPFALPWNTRKTDSLRRADHGGVFLGCWRRACAALALLAAFMVMTGCYQSPPLDRIEILRVIQSERDFQQPLTIAVPRTAAADCSLAPAVTKGWQKLLAARVIAISAIRSGCQAELAPDARQILGVRPSAIEAPTLAIALARRNIVSIDAQTPDGGGVAVRFTWNWDPNDIGRRTGGIPSSLYQGKADLQLVRDIWTAVRVEVEPTPDPLQ